MKDVKVYKGESLMKRREGIITSFGIGKELEHYFLDGQDSSVGEECRR